MATKWNLLFPEGKRKAVTFSYDDGLVHDRKLVELFNTYHVKGTFNLNSGELGRIEVENINGVKQDNSTVTAKEVRQLYNGHEVASHTVTHPSLPALDTSVMSYEVITDRKNLEDITGYIVNGFAYPYGTYNDTVKSVLQMCGIQYARTVISTHQFELPTNPLEWNPTCHHNDDKLMELAKEFCEEDDIYRRLRLFYIWGHSYEFARNNDWDTIKNLLKYMQPYLSDIWVATNSDIITYYNAFKQAKYYADGSTIINTSGIDLYFEGNDGPIVVKKFTELSI
nr:polysaccharide deacetylase family protein [uncultured Anaerosporobacter sp.]